jgi:hypothetical protein
MKRDILKEIDRLLGLGNILTKPELENIPAKPRPFKWRPTRLGEGAPAIRNHPESHVYPGMGVYGWNNNSDQVSPLQVHYAIKYDAHGNAQKIPEKVKVCK